MGRQVLTGLDARTIGKPLLLFYFTLLPRIELQQSELQRRQDCRFDQSKDEHHPDEIKNAISAVNAFHSHVIVQRLAKNSKCNKGLKVYFGTYNVDDFRICMTNLPSPWLPPAKVMDAFDYSKDGELILEQPLIDMLAAGALDFAKSQMGEVVAGRSSLNPPIDLNRV